VCPNPKRSLYRFSASSSSSKGTYYTDKDGFQRHAEELLSPENEPDLEYAEEFPGTLEDDSSVEVEEQDGDIKPFKEMTCYTVGQA
jgi:hypothetical protein